MLGKKCPYAHPTCLKECAVLIGEKCAEVVKAEALAGIAGLLAQLVKKEKKKAEKED